MSKYYISFASADNNWHSFLTVSKELANKTVIVIACFGFFPIRSANCMRYNWTFCGITYQDSGYIRDDTDMLPFTSDASVGMVSFQVSEQQAFDLLKLVIKQAKKIDEDKNEKGQQDLDIEDKILTEYRTYKEKSTLDGKWNYCLRFTDDKINKEYIQNMSFGDFVIYTDPENLELGLEFCFIYNGAYYKKTLNKGDLEDRKLHSYEFKDIDNFFKNRETIRAHFSEIVEIAMLKSGFKSPYVIAQDVSEKDFAYHFWFAKELWRLKKKNNLVPHFDSKAANCKKYAIYMLGKVGITTSSIQKNGDYLSLKNFSCMPNYVPDAEAFALRRAKLKSEGDFLIWDSGLNTIPALEHAYPDTYYKMFESGKDSIIGALKIMEDYCNRSKFFLHPFRHWTSEVREAVNHIKKNKNEFLNLDDVIHYVEEKTEFKYTGGFFSSRKTFLRDPIASSWHRRLSFLKLMNIRVKENKADLCENLVDYKETRKNQNQYKHWYGALFGYPRTFKDQTVDNLLLHLKGSPDKQPLDTEELGALFEEKSALSSICLPHRKSILRQITVQEQETYYLVL